MNKKPSLSLWECLRVALATASILAFFAGCSYLTLKASRDILQW